MKPDFLVVGASRSGTSTLHNLLLNSGAISLPRRKELHYFNDDRNFARGSVWYQQQLVRCNNALVMGEISPPYFHRGIRIGRDGSHVWDTQEDSAARIARLYPDVRIILSLRNPVTRAYSQFAKNLWQGAETASSFEEALELELAGKRSPTDTPLCWLYKNRYSVHIQRYQELFGSERVLILIFEEWVKQPRIALAAIEKFLELPAESLGKGKDIKPKNQGRRIQGVPRFLVRLGTRSRWVRSFLYHFGSRQGYGGLKQDTAKYLRQVFSNEVAYMENLLNRPIKAWYG